MIVAVRPELVSQTAQDFGLAFGSSPFGALPFRPPQQVPPHAQAQAQAQARRMALPLPIIPFPPPSPLWTPPGHSQARRRYTNTRVA